MLKLLAVGAVSLTVVYWIVAVYARSVRREGLENEFDGGGIPGLREDHIAAGLATYEHGLRRRLVLLVYVIPVALIVTIAYIVNHT